MLTHFVSSYYTFFDHTLKSTTFVVLLVAALICAVGILVPNTSAWYMQENILQSGLNNFQEETSIITIDGVNYRVSLLKIDI